MKTGAVGYTPGSYYKRSKSIGLHQPRNMKAMNREAVESVNSAYSNTGPKIFETKSTEYYGLSELAAQQVLKRAQDLADKLASGGESLSAANGGNGAAVNQVV
jgi:hypothetical protein